MSQEKKRRGRPKKMPEGKPHYLRLVLVNGEWDNLRKAVARTGISQSDFNRLAVIHAAGQVASGKSAPFDPASTSMAFRGKAGAGRPSLDESPQREWINLRSLYPEDAELIRADGWSMELAGIADKDLLVVRPAPMAEHGQKVIAVVDEGLTVKRLEYVAKGERKGFWLVSMAKDDRPPIRLSGLEDRRIVAVVVGIVRKF